MFGNFFIFFLFFSFLFLPFLFFCLSPSSFLLLTYSSQGGSTDRAIARPHSCSPPWQAPCCPQAMPPSPPPPSPLSPLQRALPWPVMEAPTPAMVALPWRASHKLVFLCGMIKTDAYDPPVAIPTLNFI
jgi:hypothetical protein